MKLEWCYFHRVMNDELCDSTIKSALELPAIDATMGPVGTGEDRRRQKVRFINRNDPRFFHLFTELMKYAMSANNDFFFFHLSKLDYIQFEEVVGPCEQSPENMDVFYMNGDPFYHRKLSCVVQLTDPAEYEGGELRVTGSLSPLEKGCADRGSVIFFPSFFRHKTEAMEKGTCYRLRCWIDGPRWR